MNRIYFFLCYTIAITIVSGCSAAKKDNVSEQTTLQNPNGRNDAWGFMGYGGGGAMFNPAVSPFNTDYAFVACDMTGSFVTYNGGESWRMFNLRGPVDFFVFDPSDSNIVYANSIALFRSIDRGKTWNVIYPSPEKITGIVSKGDHASEQIITNDKSLCKVLALAVDPADGKKLFAVISVDTVASFCTSADGGAHWQTEQKIDGGVSNVFVHPGSPLNNRTVYITAKNFVACRENGVWKKNSIPTGVHILTKYTGGFDKASNAFILYGISGTSYFNTTTDSSGIFYSNDGGATWENRQQSLLAFNRNNKVLPEWRAVATSALQPSTLYVSYRDIQIGNDTSSIGVAKSIDYGKTWTLCWQDTLTRNKEIASSNFTDGWLNERFGPTWGENPFCMGVAPQDANICYATDFGRTIKTMDGGKTWHEVYSKKKTGAGWMSRGLEVTTGYSVVFDPFDNSHVFITNTDVGLMESHDGGESWLSATKQNGIPREWVNSVYWLTFDPKVKGRAWAVMSNTHDLPRPKMWRKKGVKDYKGGILLTEDAGKTWRVMSSSIGDAAFTHILLDSNKGGVAAIYAAAFGKGVYKSTDNGKTWQLKNKGIEGSEPFAWRLVKADHSNKMYLIVSRRSEDGSIGNDKDGAVYYTTDGAENWVRLQLPEGTNAPTGLALDATDSNRLILSAWGRVVKEKFVPDTGGGIFVSNDHGKNWHPVLEHDQYIHDITYDSRNHTFYACGFNSSAYRSGDGGNVWQRIKGYNFKWGKRVDLDPRDPQKIFIITFGGGVWYGPAKGDSTAVEDIVTPVLSYK
ncbi:MAG: hypothetical protein QM802_25100 [Agriterribacter sp.]